MTYEIYYTNLGENRFYHLLNTISWRWEASFISDRIMNEKIKRMRLIGFDLKEAQPLTIEEYNSFCSSIS